MTGVARAVFRALHEGKWLSIEYRNGSDMVTRFWAGIRGLDAKKTLPHRGRAASAQLHGEGAYPVP